MAEIKKENLERVRAGLAAMQQRIEEMTNDPNHNEIELERLKLEYTATNTVFETMPKMGSGYKETTEAETLGNESLITLYLLESTKNEVPVPTAEQIVDRQQEIVKDPAFKAKLNAVIGSANAGPFEHYANKRVEMLCDGPSKEHIMSRIDEMRHPIDYEKEFERLAVDVPEAERKELHDKFITVSLLNQGNKRYDYKLGKTPEQLMEVVQTKLPEEDRNAFQAANDAWEGTNRASEKWRATKPTIPNPVNMPSAISRSYCFFFDLKSPAENQEIINRLYSDAPEDIAFQKQTMMNMINQMLSLTDEQLAVQSAQERAGLIQEHAKTIQMLFEVPNMMTWLKKEYQLPPNIIEALEHKSRLAQDIVVESLPKIQSAVTVPDEERLMYEGIQGLDDFQTRYENTAFMYEKGEAFGRGIAFAAGLQKVERIPSETVNDPAHDGLTLTDAEMQPVPGVSFERLPLKETAQAEPEPLVEPEKPSRFTYLMNSLFGVWQDEIDNYNREMRTYQAELEHRSGPKTREQLEGAARGQKWREQNENRMQMEAEKATPENTAELIQRAGAEYKELVDRIFDPCEQANEMVSRLDYIMIGGKSLRGHLIDEYYAGLPQDKQSRVSTDGKVLDYVKESLQNGHAYELLAAASLQQRPIEYFVTDPKTGELVMNPSGKPEHFLDATVPSMEGLSPIVRNAMGELSAKQFSKVDLYGPKDNQERIHRIDACRASLRDLNTVNRKDYYLQTGRNLYNQFVEPWKQATGRSLEVKNGYTSGRGACQSHIIAALMVEEGMTFDQIIDPDYGREKKAEVSNKILNMMLKDAPGPTREEYEYLTRINLQATEKLVDLIDEQMKSADLNKPRALWTDATTKAIAMETIAVDLMQEVDRKNTVPREIREQVYQQITGAKDLKAGTEKLEALHGRVKSVAQAMPTIATAAENIARLGTGAVDNLTKAHNGLVSAAAIQKEYRACVKNSLTKSFDEKTGALITGLSQSALQKELSYTDSDLKVVVGDYGKDAGIKFAEYALSGGFHKDTKFKLNEKTGLTMDHNFSDASKKLFAAPKPPVKEAPSKEAPVVSGPQQGSLH